MPATGEAHDAVSKWLDDWDQWLRDRATWAAKLRTGDDAQFFEKQRESGEPNSEALNAFAITNGMKSCQSARVACRSAATFARLPTHGHVFVARARTSATDARRRR